MSKEISFKDYIERVKITDEIIVKYNKGRELPCLC